MNSGIDINGPFFYAISGKQYGPVAWEDLRQLTVRGDLKRADKVWTSGMKEWQIASSIPELFANVPEIKMDVCEAHHQIATGQPQGCERKNVTAEDNIFQTVVSKAENNPISGTNSKFSQVDRVVIGSVVAVIIVICAWPLIRTWEQSFSRSSQQQDWSWLNENKTTNEVRSESLALKAEYDRTNEYSYRPQPLATDSEPGEHIGSTPAPSHNPGPSPEATRNDRMNAEREKRFNADVQDVARQLRATTSYSESAIASMAPKIVEKARRDRVTIQYGRGPGPSDEEIEEMVYASRRVVDRLP